MRAGGCTLHGVTLGPGPRRKTQRPVRHRAQPAAVALGAVHRGQWPPPMRRVTVAMSQVRDDGGAEVAPQAKAPDPPGGAHEPDASSAGRIFGVEPDVAAIVLVYFVQGALGLSRLATSFFLKDELHLDPAQLSLLTGAATLPWLVKPLWGFLSDSVPIAGYRRRSYLVLAGVTGTCGWLALATVVDSPALALAALLATSLSTAVSDVVVDSLVVERSRHAPAATAGSLQSLCWGASSVGAICTALYSGSLVQTYGTHPVFLATACFPILTAAVAPLVRDSPPAGLGAQAKPSWASIRGQVDRLVSAGRQRSVWAPAVFLFLWQAAPSPDSALFFFTTSQLHFTPEFLGKARLAGALASLAGVGLYNYGGLKRVSIRTIFTWCALLGSTLGMTQLILVTGLNRQWGISDQVFALSDTVVLTALGQVSFMPTLVLAARMCPPGVEATLFAALMSVFNAAGVASGAAGAALTWAFGVTATNDDNLPALIVTCNLLSLAALPFLSLLESSPGLARPDDDDEDVPQPAEGTELQLRAPSEDAAWDVEKSRAGADAAVGDATHND